MQAGGHLSAAAARAVTGKTPGQVTPEEYKLVTDPARELTRRAAIAVRTLAEQLPMIILLDTGEVIGDRAWGWLRRVMAHSGPRVAWVVGARFETEAEVGADSPIAQFVRDVGDERLMLMSPTRFDDTTIRAYLERRRDAHTSTEFTEPQVDMIARFTRGLPLAVSFTATLLDQDLSIEAACQEAPDGQPSSVVSRLARRYLVHAEQQDLPEDDPRRDDMAKILGLALVFGDLRKDPELLAALRNIEPGQAQVAFEDLARRHDFVLLTSHRLHDDVRDTLRSDLLDPFRRARAKQINERALTLFSVRLAHMRRRWPTLDEQLAHATFTASLLAVMWHTLWVDNQAGLDQFICILPVLAVADPPTADAAAAMIAQLSVTFDQDQQYDLDLLTQSEPETSFDDLLLGRGTASRTARSVKITVPGLDLHPPGLDASDCLIGEPDDRPVAVMILQAGLHAREQHDDAAVTALLIAGVRATSTRLREAVGAQAHAIAARLLRGSEPRALEPAVIGLAAAKLATEMFPGNASAWESYGAALDGLGRFDLARDAHERAHANSIPKSPGGSLPLSTPGPAILIRSRTASHPGEPGLWLRGATRKR